MKSQRIYLDNAATSWPKPPAVVAAIYTYLTECGAPAGRSVYRDAVQADQWVRDGRLRIARLLGVPDPNRVIFTANGTDGLNLALHGLIRAGDHVVTSDAEHNSILRPLRYLEESAGIRVTRVPCDETGWVSPDDLLAACRPETRLVALTHASNVTGTLQPIDEISDRVGSRGIHLLVDAAQSLGHIAWTIADRPIIVAAPAHKGLLGPLGLGILYVPPGLEHAMVPLRQGGTGTRSEDDVQPSSLPDRFESGNLNVPAIVGLRAAADFLATASIPKLREHEVRLTQMLLDGVRQLPGVREYGTRSAADRVGVVSLSIAGFDPQEVAALLDAAHTIQVRSGLHCAPRMHRTLGTIAQGGTVRFSLGPYTTEDDIQRTLAALAEIAEGST